jgi:hypothetical protein
MIAEAPKHKKGNTQKFLINKKKKVVAEKDLNPLAMQSLSIDLQKIAKEGHQFRNWANTFGCSPELYFEPSTEREIVEVKSQCR